MKCPHGWTVSPEIPCAKCDAERRGRALELAKPKTYAHAIRWRAQDVPGAAWSEWHKFARVDGPARGTRCRLTVEVGRFSVERGALPIGAPVENACVRCFA